MRVIMLSAAALLLAGCGGETYPVPIAQAYPTLTTLASSAGLNPLPIGLNDVGVSLEPLPAENAVRLKFRHDGEDLGNYVVRAEADGDAASTISYEFVEGTAPDKNWRNGSAKKLIEREVPHLVSEAIDSKFENRPFDQTLLQTVGGRIKLAAVGGVLSESEKRMKEGGKRRRAAEQADEAAEASDPSNATRPMTDLSKFN